MMKDSSGELRTVDWPDVIVTAAKVLDSTPGDRIGVLAGGMADAEALVALKDLMNRLGCENLCTEESFPMEYGGNISSSKLMGHWAFSKKRTNVRHLDPFLSIRIE